MKNGACSSPHRRPWLVTIGVGLLGLGGCGFELRRAPRLPYARLALAGFAPGSPLADELQRSLPEGTTVVADAARADAVLQALLDRRERSVVAATAAGQVRALQLRVRLQYRLLSPGGRELIGDTTLLQSRDMTYSETVALAKQQEEGELYAAMQSDIVLQLVRRLAQQPGTGGSGR
jgi:LPS-assembly lipoprotein